MAANINKHNKAYFVRFVFVVVGVLLLLLSRKSALVSLSEIRLVGAPVVVSIVFEPKRQSQLRRAVKRKTVSYPNHASFVKEAKYSRNPKIKQKEDVGLTHPRMAHCNPQHILWFLACST